MGVPKLDDVTFVQLIEEALKRIPQFKSEWTDHNIHDPGIKLIELLTWIAEIKIFSFDLTKEERRKFVKFVCSKIQKGRTLNETLLEVHKITKMPHLSQSLLKDAIEKERKQVQIHKTIVEKENQHITKVIKTNVRKAIRELGTGYKVRFDCESDKMPLQMQVIVSAKT